MEMGGRQSLSFKGFAGKKEENERFPSTSTDVFDIESGSHVNIFHGVPQELKLGPHVH